MFKFLNKKKVNFYDKVSVVLIPETIEYIDCNIYNDLWYTKNDYNNFICDEIKRKNILKINKSIQEFQFNKSQVWRLVNDTDSEDELDNIKSVWRIKDFNEDDENDLEEDNKNWRIIEFNQDDENEDNENELDYKSVWKIRNDEDNNNENENELEYKSAWKIRDSKDNENELDNYNPIWKIREYTEEDILFEECCFYTRSVSPASINLI